MIHLHYPSIFFKINFKFTDIDIHNGDGVESAFYYSSSVYKG